MISIIFQFFILLTLYFLLNIQKTQFNLGNQIKSKKIKKKNGNLDIKKEKYIVACQPNFIIQNLIQLIPICYKFQQLLKYIINYQKTKNDHIISLF